MPGGLHPPLELVLAWQTDAFPHGIRRDPTLVVMVAILYFVTFSVFLGRIYARLFARGSAGLDDLLIALAMIPTTGLAISICLADRLYGFDRHIWDLSADLAVKAREITFAISAFYILSTSLTKLSILCFYRRMATNTIERWFLIAVWASKAFVLGYMITFILTTFLGCRPLESYWNQVNPAWAESHSWHCFNEGAVMLSASAISVAQDFLACGLPLLLFRKLQIPRRQKIVLGCVFGVGMFLCITGLLRILYIRPLYATTFDITWAARPAWAWTAVEAHLAVICASAPALKLFFRRLLAVSGYASSPSSPSRCRKTSASKHHGLRSGANDRRAFEMGAWGVAGEEGPARGASADGGVRRMGSLRGTSSAKVERGSWFGDFERAARACRGEGEGDGLDGMVAGAGAGGGSVDPEMGFIQVAKSVDVTVTEAREEGESEGEDGGGKDAASVSSSETRPMWGGGRTWL